MKIFLSTYIFSLFLLLVFDAVWLLFIVKRFVADNIGHLMSESIKLGPVFVFYPLYALAIVVLVLLPGIEGNFSFLKVFLFGFVLGIAAYGAYDLTNHATLKNWPLMMTIVDMTWGSLMTGGVSVLSFYLVNLFIK